MQSPPNRIVVACAGSGKTTLLVKDALSKPDKSIAILTYTLNNRDAIIQKFGELNSGVPRHVEILTWFTFLLRECARPYQHSIYAQQRIETLAFVNGQTPTYAGQSNPARYYFSGGADIYSDKISSFIIACEQQTNGRVIKRIARCYNEILIDEFQDLAGWDLEVVARFLESGIETTLVCDPRQSIYVTNHGAKHKQYRGVGVIGLIREWEKKGLCRLEHQTECHRSNQKICDFADSLWSDMPPTKSLSTDVTDHDGLFLVPAQQMSEYIRCYSPCLLRYDKRTTCPGHEPLNFGMSKGLQFDRVLIIPHGSIRKYLKSGDIEQLGGSREKFYVAITRAKHSVGIVYDDQCALPHSRWIAT